MNAYELADDLEGWCDDVLSNQNRKNVFKKHAKMLRQQADKIKNMEQWEKLYLDRIAELEKLTREPTKLLAVPDLMAKAGFFKRGERVANQIQTKPLSDEEIYELWCEADNTELLPEMRLKDGSINYIITTFAKLIEERHGIK